MITGLLKKVFGSRNDRLLRQYMHGVRAINALEAEIAKLSDAALQAKTEAALRPAPDLRPLRAPAV